MNLYKAYIKAWSNYEQDKFIYFINNYFRDMFNFSELWDIRHFDEAFSIERGDNYDVFEDYVIIYWGGSREEIVWKGDYPTEEVIKKCLEVLG